MVGTYLTVYDLWQKPNKITTWSIVQVQSMPKTKLSCHDRLEWVRSMPKLKPNYRDLFDRVWSVRKNIQNNSVFYCTSVIYEKNEIEVSWSIELGVICDENKIGQWHDLSNKCGLYWKWNWVVIIDRIVCSMWLEPNKTTTWLIK